MYKKLYLALILFSPYFSFAQNNYKTGLIVSSKGDTTHGLINYKEWNQNPDEISFKLQADQQPQRLGVKDIKYFEVNGYTSYRRYTVNISLNSLDVQDLTTTANKATKSVTVFLKILTSGKNATLFSYTDNLKQRFFSVDQKNAEPLELTYLKYLDPENKESIITQKFYQGQLMILATDNHVDLSDKIASASYTEGDLIEIISKINGEHKKPADSHRQPAIKWFVGASAISNTLKYDGDVNGGFLSGSTSTVVSPAIAFGIDGYLNPSVGRTVLRINISFSTANYNLSKTLFNQATNLQETNSQQLKQYYISLDPQLIYNFYNTPALKIYGGAGAKLSLAWYPINTTVFANPHGGQSVESGFPEMNSFYAALIVKAGIIISKKVDLYFCYNPKTILTADVPSDEAVTSYQIGINYFLGK